MWEYAITLAHQDSMDETNIIGGRSGIAERLCH